MPSMQLQFRTGTGTSGGILGYPSEQMQEEVALIALHFHWALGDILSLEHPERRLWVGEISKLLEPE